MMDPRDRILVVATSNRGKLEEFRRLLSVPWTLVSLADLGITLPPEDGTDFASIADRKATAAADASGRLAIADDSGIEVDALGGLPGVRSARFAGEPTDDEKNRERLLREMAIVPDAERGARFVCAVTIARPGRLVARSIGIWTGRVARTARGERGFGYDPLFLTTDGRTAAELGHEEKDAVSHRGQAVRALLPTLLEEWGR